ncbi:MAG: N-acetylmuramoyl-L-alanine amidase [Clostridium sp.]|uniref:N-acetylmuramoyl-L-alanine amidase n=1 Tax=Clostridium sp. TaxID=1506 RepID=UPI00290C6620|nr:N-acetylmuramoyl-L-alanine amidase [Clostridium sp.]MDU7948680.1 N-acetylmuramoyl-L-alanine amidase [Clostridium sp.]
MSKTLKILLIAGHGAGDPGACSNYGVEATETRRVVEMLKAQFGTYNVSVDVYPTNRNAYEDVKNGCVQVNFTNYDYVLEIHFNSAGNVSANGVEVWVTPSESGIKVEQLIVNKIASLGYLNRGVKREDFAVIRSAKNKGVSSALIEVCFISNQADMNKYNNNFENICKAIVDGVGEGFSLSKNNNVVVVPQPVNPVEKPKASYFVKTPEGKQLGAFSVLDNAKNMAKGNKAIVYNTDGSVLISYIPQVSTGQRYAENGAYYFTTAVTVRTAPEESAKTNTVYYVGECVIYNHVILNKNGFNWIEYARDNRTTGYLKVKDLATGESYGYAK